MTSRHGCGARRRATRGSVALSAGLALVLLAGACGGGGSKTKATAQTGSSTTAAPTTTAPPTVPSPITGLPVDPTVVGRPVVSVKVDNGPDGRPQAGLDKTDLMVEEKVEGGVTRFISVFQSQDADLIGPIRSVRTTDANIVAAFGGVFVFSGGAGIAVKRIQGAPVKLVSEQENGADPFIYPPGKRRPYMTYSSTQKLRKAGGASPKELSPFFSFLAEGEEFAPAGVAPATKATVGFGGNTTATFDWDAASRTWLRSTNGVPHTLQDGSRLAFTNVILQSVPYRGVGYLDASKTAVDEAVVVGTGDAVVLVDGKQVKARWTKSSPAELTRYTDSAGNPIKLLPGRTLVVLPPTSASISIS
ncbi:MAG TPA: DUF3048 domain-containing protein [Acidimicrobiales bacterium]|nr:DUF3048 domain-containing protein [Acidimicrobiales bacterium]